MTFYNASSRPCSLCGALPGETHAVSCGVNYSKVDHYFAQIEVLDRLWFSMTPEEQDQVDGKLSERAMKRPGT